MNHHIKGDSNITESSCRDPIRLHRGQVDKTPIMLSRVQKILFSWVSRLFDSGLLPKNLYSKIDDYEN